MSKKHRIRPITWLLIFGLFIGLFLVSSGSAQRGAATQQSPVATRSARNAAVAAATDSVLKEMSGIRELSIVRPVQSGTLSRAEIERSIIKNLDEDMTPAEMHANEVTLKKLGQAPADFQFRPLIIKVLTEQVAGYYDPKAREFYLADWIDLDGQKPIMAHELTHALQDQHFNLRRFEHWPKGDSDAELAAHALIEGDATLAMMLYIANNPLRALAFLKSLGGMEMSSAELDKAPRAVRETLLFPYQNGYEWTRDLYKQGKWGAVSNAFTELPQSTEQILHPEKYFAHEAPVKVTLPDITPLLNGSAGVSPTMSAKREGGDRPPMLWKKIDSDVEGEWGFYLLLDQFLKAPAESRRAAAGWGGDRYEVYEDQKGDVLFASLSTWDTEIDARQFFDAYVKRIELRYPGARPNSERETPNALVLKTNEDTVAIELRASRVLIIEGIPLQANPDSLVESLWK
jgi:hypothetical protein